MGKESYHSFQQTLVGQERVMDPLDRLRGRLITCKTCGLQYVGSTKTQFRFDNHETDIRRHGNLGHVQRDQDDLIFKHFRGEGHHELEDTQIQLIDRVSNEEELRDREGKWAYRLITLSPYCLNENDFF